jgi:D-sedoheptulose 7-phosphate isomerase
MSDAASLESAALRKAAEGARVQQAFFEGAAPALARCARALADRFGRGARLFTMGNGGSACDAEHVAVEFLHPVIRERRALPAFALTTSSALLSAVGNDRDFSFAFADSLHLLAREGDVALGISTSGDSANVCRALGVARELGCLTVGLSGRDGGRMAALCDHAFVVPSYSIHRIQEVHVAILHVLWDLVHLSLGEEDVL